MSDLISRQAAIDAMMRLQTEDIEMYGCAIPEGFDGDRAAEALKALTHAQPDRRDCGWTGIEDDYPVSVREVIDITSETGALVTQSRVMELEPYRLPESKTGRWIPCSERLPEKDEYVLCTTITVKGRKNVVRGYYSGPVWVCGMNTNVIAWMPMPEPYEG